MDFVPSHRLQSLLSESARRRFGVVEQFLPVFLVLKRLKQVHVDAECKFSGCHRPERAGDYAFLWTKRKAVIECVFPAAHRFQFAWLEVENTAPQGSCVTVRWDDDPIMTERHVQGRTTLVLKLPKSRNCNRVNLQIESNTFTPSTDGPDADSRELGIALRGVVFAKRRSKYAPRSLFRPGGIGRVIRMLPRALRRPFEKFLKRPALRRPTLNGIQNVAVTRRETESNLAASAVSTQRAA